MRWPSHEDYIQERAVVKRKLKNESTLEIGTAEECSQESNENPQGDTMEDNYSVYRKRSALVAKRRERSRDVTDKPNNIPIILEGGASITRIPLRDATFWPGRNERSPLDDPNKPVYSSFAKDGVFRPETAYKGVRVLLNRSEERYRFELRWVLLKFGTFGSHKSLFVQSCSGQSFTRSHHHRCNPKPENCLVISIVIRTIPPINLTRIASLSDLPGPRRMRKSRAGITINNRKQQ